MDSKSGLVRAVAALVVVLLLNAARLEAASVTLAWDANPEPDVTGYMLRYGTQPGVYTAQVNVGNRTQYSLLSIPEGTYYFTVQAYNGEGIISAPSAEVTAVVRNRFLPATPAPDFDGDIRTDLTIWRPSTGAWTWSSSLSGSTTSGASGTQWGSGSVGDVPLSGDIDGDGINDLVVWRPTDGTWYWLMSSSNFTRGDSRVWGGSGDVPMLSDLDGDGADDLVVWRPSTGEWFWLTSSSNYTAADTRRWGGGGDVPLLADFDGDGRADITVWRPSTGDWFWLKSSNNWFAADTRRWGGQGDRPLLGDFDGDGRADITVFRPSTGQWFWATSGSGYRSGFVTTWGGQGDVPLLGDFDGDRRADIAVWRPSTGQWFWLTSSSTFTAGFARTLGSGAAGDIPVVK
jgi:VCBS repeat protein